MLKQNGKNVFRVARFDTVMLFSFDFPLNFLKTSLATHYVACSFLLAWRSSVEFKVSLPFLKCLV